ncbi:hypothetical protein BD289DRAFT_167338 [Coniella lustricola]|uniref:Rhodopsin domain-containing protein n=1 Tax=Coniella lustricola TaxID=2025994 RepID=A0A2T3AE73_9PEZI|nr:hypothetical protein BD289DRAFT_167338 [Coniella lustricola]
MPSNRDVQPHPDRMSSSGLANIIYGTVVLALSLVCVALRFLHRMRTNNLWWDDWTILAGLFTGIGVYVCLVLDALPSGGASGYHTDTYTLAGLYVWGRISLAMGAIYIVSIAFSRVSVLLFYRRIFSVDAVFLRFVRIVAALVVAICVTYFFGAIFQDRARVLNTDITKPYTSVNAGIFFFFTGLVNILLDVAIVALVQHRLWRLHMGWRRKLGLSALLLVVVLSIIAGVLRLMYLARSSRTDLTCKSHHVLPFRVLLFF